MIITSHESITTRYFTRTIFAACFSGRLIPISDAGGHFVRNDGRRGKASPFQLRANLLYWCIAKPLLGPLLTLSASSIGTRCQDTEVITFLRLCVHILYICVCICACVCITVGIPWSCENRLPQNTAFTHETCSLWVSWPWRYLTFTI